MPDDRYHSTVHRINKKDKTIDHGNTELQKNSGRAKIISGFSFFGFFCTFVFL
jgi:hypothetical protein